MALYSVWNWRRNAWAIYETPTPASVGDDPIPPRPRPASPIGADPDSDVKPLPRGARFAGFSHVARGEVRRLPGGMFDMGDDAGASSTPQPFWSTPAMAFALGVVATVAYFRWRRQR